jgi:enamine deaminase RidA (YjgF/YER057c/UK114 family)
VAGFAEMKEACASVFPGPLPARTTVGVALAGFKVEISWVAVLPPASG